jgi:hypothetical protein
MQNLKSSWQGPSATTGRPTYPNSSPQSMPRLSYSFHTNVLLMWNFVDSPKRNHKMPIEQFTRSRID